MYLVHVKLHVFGTCFATHSFFVACFKQIIVVVLKLVVVCLFCNKFCSLFYLFSPPSEKQQFSSALDALNKVGYKCFSIKVVFT